MGSPLTLTVVYARLIEIHGESFEYPYLNMEYRNSSSQITMVCPIHGSISKTIGSIINGKTGCPKCASLRRVISRCSNKDLARAEMIRFYSYIKQHLGDSLKSSIIKPDYNKIAKAYMRLRVCDGHGDYLSKPNRMRRLRDA